MIGIEAMPARISGTWTGGSVRHVPADDLAAHIDENLVDVGATASAGLVVRGVAPLLRDGKGAGAADLSVFLQV